MNAESNPSGAERSFETVDRSIENESLNAGATDRTHLIVLLNDKLGVGR